MKFIALWEKGYFKDNKYYIEMNWRKKAYRCVLNTDDLQLAPPPKTHSYGQEPDLQFLLSKLAASTNAYYDIGANYGFFSIYLSSHDEFKGNVYSFEPMPKTYKIAQALLEALPSNHNIAYNNLALSDKSGELEMQVPVNTHSGYAKISDSGSGGTKVKVMTLDEWVESNNATPPSFIKIDVEGHEAQVLKGGEQTISKHRPIVYFESGMDLSKEENDEISSYFLDKGYRLFIPTWMYLKDDLWQTCRLPIIPEASHFTLIDISNSPEILHDRSMLYVLNILACPKEKVEALKLALAE
jgi:FkbM family methyltransferase